MQREITQEMAKDRLPRREADANKGSFGSVALSAPGRALSTWPAWSRWCRWC